MGDGVSLDSLLIPLWSLFIFPVLFCLLFIITHDNGFHCDIFTCVYYVLCPHLSSALLPKFLLVIPFLSVFVTHV